MNVCISVYVNTGARVYVLCVRVQESADVSVAVRMYLGGWAWSPAVEFGFVHIQVDVN